MALTEERIVATAHALLVDRGLPDLTMRRIAAELDVRPGALYYHVDSKQQLLARIAARVLRPLQAPAPDEDPRELMARFRRLVLPLRDGGDLMLVAFGLDPQLPPVPGLVGQLTTRGFGDDDAEQRAAAAVRLSLGAVAVEQNAALLRAVDAQASDDAAREAACRAAEDRLHVRGIDLLLG